MSLDHTYFTRSTVVVAFSFVNENETNTKRKRNEKDPLSDLSKRVAMINNECRLCFVTRGNTVQNLLSFFAEHKTLNA